MDKKSQKNIVLTPELIKDGVVILPLEEYQKLCKRAVPTYYLSGKEAEELDKLVEEGLREYREGKCKSIESLADLD